MGLRSRHPGKGRLRKRAPDKTKLFMVDAFETGSGKHEVITSTPSGDLNKGTRKRFRSRQKAINFAVVQSAKKGADVRFDVPYTGDKLAGSDKV